MAIYTSTPTGTKASEWNVLTDDERREREKSGIEAWHEWARANGAAIVDGGTALGQTRRTSRTGIAQVKNDLCACVIVRAESHEAAAKLFENHPFYTMLPGDAVETMECLPTPPEYKP
ncbi:MAG: hypothetical protein ACRESR_05710 [Gammaproteobacteria bacterium]